MEYRDLVIDFIDRTTTNLELIEAWRLDNTNGADFSEVTQLINSLLGLIVIPSERGGRNVRRIRVEVDGIPSWNSPFRLKGEGAPPRDLRQLLRGLRNSTAHGAITPIADGRNITGLEFQFYTGPGPQDPPRWTATFALSELDIFLRKLIVEIREAYERRRST